ncbi:MAG: hypothetical protein ACRDOK_01590 [Streptosporangiaceae bacterium]
MRSPRWLAEKTAGLGTRLLSGEISRDSATAALTGAIVTDRAAVTGLAADHAHRALARWLRRQGAAGQADQGVLFPGLPVALDVTPGTFRSQGDMTRHDWVNHLAIAQARRDNAIEGAKVHFAAVLRAYQTVMPLLTDEVMTTSEALRRGHAA